MNRMFQKIFTTPGKFDKLTFVGNKTDEHWQNGYLESEVGNKYEVINGIPLFCPENDCWNEEALVQIDALFRQYDLNRNNLVPNEYNKKIKYENHKYKDWVSHIATYDGIFIEFACGPGGGLAPLILENKPNCHLLFNDLGYWVLKEWQKIGAEKHWHNVGFAQFDFSVCPIESNTIDVLDSLEGIGNIGKSKSALKESYRILKPGGKLFLFDGLIDNDVFLKLPIEAKNDFNEYCNGYVNLIFLNMDIKMF